MPRVRALASSSKGPRRVGVRTASPPASRPRLARAAFCFLLATLLPLVAGWALAGAWGGPPRRAPLLRPGPLRSAELARVFLDAARSTATHVIPRVAREALQRLSIPEFVDVALACPRISVELPPGGGRNATVLGFSGAADFWLASSAWEPATFRVLAAVLAARPGVVIDFGAWIGPTLIAAANLPTSTRVFGLEVDPVAFTQLALNVAANPAVAAKAHVFFLGVSDSFSERQIVANACAEGVGDSCSSMHAPPHRSDLLRFSVQTLPLPAFVEAAGIRPEEISLIKIDAEGAEVFILPTLAAWMSQWPGGVKPGVWLSLHSFSIALPWYDRAAPFMRLFKYGYALREPENTLKLAWGALDAATGPSPARCAVLCTYLLSDTPVDASLVEAPEAAFA